MIAGVSGPPGEQVMPAPGTVAPAYRAPMRSRLAGVPEHAAVERGLELGRCGIGGRLPRTPADLAEAVVETERVHGTRSAARLVRFAEVPDGTTVWTCDSAGVHHRGVLAGGWEYDATAAARDADLVHVRPCDWRAVPAAAVPELVSRSFQRGGRNFQAIRG